MQSPIPARAVRPLLAVALSLLLLGIAWASGAFEVLTAERVRQIVDDAGSLGVLVYLVGFVLGTMMAIPGLVFLVAGLVAWGPVTGSALGLTGGLLSATTNFYWLRAVGGQPELPETGIMRRIFDQIEERPVLSIAALRCMFVLAPPLNLALALSSISYRDYIVGTGLGLAAVIAVQVLFYESVVAAVGG